MGAVLRRALAVKPGGRYPHARDFVDAMRAARQPESSDERESRILLALGENPDRIEGTLSRASELIAETGARSHEPQVHELRAWLASACGDDTARKRELREAHRLYTEMGATGHAERVAR